MTPNIDLRDPPPPPPARLQVPLGDDLTNAVAGAALRDVVAMRVSQIVEHGHTREADADLPLDWLPRDAQRRIGAAVDRIRGTVETRNLPAARLALVRVAALCLAGIDRLEAAIAADARRSPPSAIDPGTETLSHDKRRD